MNTKCRIASVFLVLVSFCLWIAGCGSDSGGSGTVPVAPTSVTATAGDGQVVINWEPVTNATSYIMYGAETPGVTPKTANMTIFFNGKNGPLISSSLYNGTTYFYVMTAVNSTGESVSSTEVSATPAVGLPVLAAPTDVTATAGSGIVSISWKPVIGATHYNIYYSTAAGVTKATGTKLAGYINTFTTYIVNPQVVNSLINGTPYFFIVTALNSNGESSESSEVSATPVAN